MSPEDIAAMVDGIRDRVRERHERVVHEIYEFELPELEPLGLARDAAEGKAAAIGQVNPRKGGPVNAIIQRCKKTTSRVLNWFVRGQVEFNRAVVTYMDRQIEAAIDHNHNILRAANEVVAVQQRQAEMLEQVAALANREREVGEGFAKIKAGFDEFRDRHSKMKGALDAARQHLEQTKWGLQAAEENLAALHRDHQVTKSRVEAQHDRLERIRAGHEDVLRHWKEWRPAWEEKMSQMEIYFLHAVREIEGSARSREELFRLQAKRMHDDYRESLIQASDGLQREFYENLNSVRADFDHRLNSELRLLRRRAQAPAVVAGAAPATAPAPAPAFTSSDFDYARFEERFRGKEEYVAETQRVYLDFLGESRRVVDIGCGRGEFLVLMKERGAEVRGVDLDPDAVAACREKDLDVTHGDLFEFLASLDDESVDSIVCAHVVEHLPVNVVPRLIESAYAKLAPGGHLLIETPNPGCLAIFAGDFFLDPTHVRPVPANYLHFLMEEAGYSAIEVRELHAAKDLIGELAALDKIKELRGFRKRFFGGLDYLIAARKWKA